MSRLKPLCILSELAVAYCTLSVSAALWCAPLSETAHRKMSFFSSVLSSLGCVKPVLSRQPDGMKVWCRKYPVGVEFLWHDSRQNYQHPLLPRSQLVNPSSTSSTWGRCFLLAANVLFLSLSASALSLMLRYRETIIRKHASDVFVQSRMRASAKIAPGFLENRFSLLGIHKQSEYWLSVHP